MRTNSLAALVALTAVGLAFGQGPAPQPVQKPAAAKPDPNSLDAMIAAALKSNADIVHAEAKVSEASAALNAARLKVMQSVVTAHGAIRSAKATFELQEMLYKRTEEIVKLGQGGASEFELQKAQLDLQHARADVATAEAQLAILIGKTPGQGDLKNAYWEEANKSFATWSGAMRTGFIPMGDRVMTDDLRGTVRIWDVRDGHMFAEKFTATPVAGSMNERIRDGLKKTAKIENWKEPLPVDSVIEYLKKKAGADVPFRVLYSRPTTSGPTTVDLMAGELPLSAWLTAIEDSVPGLVFVVREYGILVTTKDRMPDDGLRVREFLLRTEPKPDAAKKP
jgi:hypothetical protein